MSKKIYLVAGHGAGDPGAVGNGCREAEEARKIVASLKEQLGRRNVPAVVYDTSKNLYMSKDYDKFPAGSEVIEIHLNAAGSTAAHGSEVLIKEGYKADSIDTAIRKTLAGYFSDRGFKPRGDLGNMNHFAARKVSYRLVEVCFITNADDMKTLKGKWNSIWSDMAAAIAKQVH